ncbi:MAG: carbamoyl phosphate synthase small subunit [Bacteroidetes bacterium GWF2_38_335]|nr:MAG: carbamoyl phosphate synthase small subunit [Bacteroidetes bacterium GWF2_38_335]OFY78341.1 MAG: carbamoyl phosphate synthase small subunit [Bacteroidetes bacterium RIFOXYA12_FULL_38_20]HBS87462.1 carbamoyl-phosphate synthase (glutamine-hydrolyzing) small subunit [Bacteroidales bacterium]
MLQNYKPARLVFEDGSVFYGKTFGYEKSVAGEVVFNTAMTGYPESLTDPSYSGQILVTTYPLVGNYGVPGNEIKDNMLRFFESEKIRITALVITDYSSSYNHWNASKSLQQWLVENKIPALCDIDTRALTKRIREKGCMPGKIIINETDCDFFDPNKGNLVDEVSIKEKKIYGNGRYKILLVDCGVKNNIIRYFLEKDTTVIRVPWNYDFSREEYHGLFLSNGPGNPQLCTATIENLTKALSDKKPVFGICLGHQLMALASGAQTYKLKYGHRSHNQPALLCGTNRAFITSQNHGFAVDETTLSNEWVPLFKNLNDGTNEGIKHKTKPFFSVQFHPEASSGPTDTDFLFDDFIKMVKEYAG